MLYSQSTSVAEYSLSVIPNRALSSPVLPSILFPLFPIEPYLVLCCRILYPLFPIEAYLILLPTILYPLFPTEAYLILLSSILSVIPNRDLFNHSLWNIETKVYSSISLRRFSVPNCSLRFLVPNYYFVALLLFACFPFSEFSPSQ